MPQLNSGSNTRVTLILLSFPKGICVCTCRCIFACHSRRESAFRQSNYALPVKGTMPEREYQLLGLHSLQPFAHSLHRHHQQPSQDNATNIANKHRAASPLATKSQGSCTFEVYQYANNAYRSRRKLKRWTRAQKIALIESMNPTWEELMPDEPSTSADTRRSRSLRE